MKKYFFGLWSSVFGLRSSLFGAFIVALFLTFSFSQQAIAQETPCPEAPTTDCIDPSWCSTQATPLITLSSGCIVRVSYQTRCNCNASREIRVIGVEFISGPCSTMVMSDMMKEVGDWIALNNPMGWTGNSFVTTFASCYSRGSDPRFVGDVALPCNWESCCIRAYTIGLVNGIRTITAYDLIGSSCPEGSTDSQGRPCEPACED